MNGTGSGDAPRVIGLRDAAGAPVSLVGGKARSLGLMLEAGIPVPPGIVLTTRAYFDFVATDGLADRVALELARKPAEEYRWEELWDASHRIRAWFLSTPPSEGLEHEVARAAEGVSGGALLVVRSSSPHEDSPERSFAGIHESVVGAHEGAELADAVKTVWASLFSDRALLYRGELGLDARTSGMAVVIQPLATSERSGIAFTRDPSGAGHGVVEAVWGLGEGLVSDRVEPDRWTLSRETGRIIGHVPPSERAVQLVVSPDGPRLAELPQDRRGLPPVDDGELADVWSTAMSAETLHGAAQDCEWTFDHEALILTQARPITTLPDDDRHRYLDLRPSVDRLEELRHLIEGERLPAMRRAAEALANVELGRLTDEALLAHAETVVGETERFRGVYEREFIPFAHGARLFGSVYLSLVRPDDPFEFVRLLARTPDELDRHRALLAELGVEYPETVPAEAVRDELERAYLDRAATDGATEYALQTLELGRASWRLRDDDNLYLELIERELERVRSEVERRIGDDAASVSLAETAAALMRADEGSMDSNRPSAQATDPVSRPRQIMGQPASPGVATGTARLLLDRRRMLELTRGDILVADALEPDTAAYAARAGGLVERRGGMLVHGAIVAREQGLPCVTGIADATRVIREGERITVDGYLGLVVLENV